MIHPREKSAISAGRWCDPEADYATDASEQRLAVEALDRGYGYQKIRGIHDSLDCEDIAYDEENRLETLGTLILLIGETREIGKVTFGETRLNTGE